MTYVGQGPGLKTTNIKRFDVTGSTSATHVLSWTAVSEQTLIITINGVKQQDDAYTIAGSPTTITLSAALLVADKMEVIGIVDMGVSTYPVDGSVSTSVLGNSSVTTAKIAADAVTATEIATDAVGTTEIAANAVDTSEIAANAVGLTEMAGLARGSVITGDASGDPSALATGTNGQFLTTDGSDLSWGAVTALPSQTSQGGNALQTDGTTASWEPTYHKNIIMNGNFNIWQRDPSFAAVANSTYVADRWFYEKTGAMVHTISKETDVPAVSQTSIKASHSLKIDCTTADASIAAGDFCNLVQRIEGYNYASFEGKEATMSFWVKATKTGIYSCTFMSGSSDRSYPAEYTVSVADTWEKKVITLTFNYSGGGWNYETGIGLQVKFALATGSNFTGTPNQWNSAQDNGSTNQVNACDSTANNFFLSQVQLEIGGVATRFEHLPISRELEDVQRYYETTMGWGTYAQYHGQKVCLAIAGSSVGATENILQGAQCRTRKRVNPSITIYDQDGTSGSVYEIHSGARIGGCVGQHFADLGCLYVQKASGFGNLRGYYYGFTADAEL